jgi:hypothetical protein
MTTATNDSLIQWTLAAAEEYQRRQEGQSRPEGKRDSGGRWYPSERERQPCCDSIRNPSRAFPWSLYRHCCTALHVASLYGVDVKALQRAYRIYYRTR